MSTQTTRARLESSLIRRENCIEARPCGEDEGGYSLEKPREAVDARGGGSFGKVAREVPHPEAAETAKGIFVRHAFGVPALGRLPRRLEPGLVGFGGRDLENVGPGPARQLEGRDEASGSPPTTKPSRSSARRA